MARPLGFGGVVDRLSHVPERIIKPVHARVDSRRLPRAGHQDRLAMILDQVFGDGVEEVLDVVLLQEAAFNF